MKIIKKLFAAGFYKSLARKKVTKDFFWVVGFKLATKPVHFIRSFMVAKYLGPSEYGLLASLNLITLLNKYGNLGFNATARREIGNAIGDNNFKKVNLIKETAYSAETILSILLFLVGLVCSLFVKSQRIAILIIIASAGLLVAKIRGVFATEAVVNKKFIQISRITFYSAIAGNIIVIATVPYLKIYAVVIANVLISLTAIILYKRVYKLKLTYKPDKKELRRILRISLPMAVGTLAQGSFKYAERILILSFLNFEVLGYFSFGVMIVSQFSVILKTGINVRTQDIYEGIGKQKYKIIHKMVVKETLILTGISMITIPLAWILLDIFVPMFLEKWIDGLSAAKFYLLMLPFEIILLYPSTVLISSLVNKQNILPFYRFGATGLLITFTIILFYLNQLTIETFIIINICCMLIYNLIIIIYYKMSFYDVYVRKSV